MSCIYTSRYYTLCAHFHVKRFDPTDRRNQNGLYCQGPSCQTFCLVFTDTSSKGERSMCIVNGARAILVLFLDTCAVYLIN